MKTLLLAGALTNALLALTAVSPLAGAEGNPSNQAAAAGEGSEMRYAARSKQLSAMLLAAVSLPAVVPAADPSPATIHAGEQHAELVAPSMTVKVDIGTGAIAGVAAHHPAMPLIDAVRSRYIVETREEEKEGGEEEDRVTSWAISPDGRSVRFDCANTALEGLTVQKTYRFEAGGDALLCDVTLVNEGTKAFFVKHFTEATTSPDFRAAAFFFRPRKGDRRAFLRAANISEPVAIGIDQSERMRMLLMAPSHGVGVVHHRHRIDGKVCLPKVGNNFTAVAAWTPAGWRYSTAAFHLGLGESRTVQLRLEVNDGDFLGHYLRYRNLPEVQHEVFDFEVPTWVREMDLFIDGMGVLLPGASEETQRVYGSTDEWHAFFREHRLNLGLRVGLFRQHWGDFASKGTYQIFRYNKENPTNPLDVAREVNLDRVYETVRGLKQGIPGVRLGQYGMLWFIDSASRFYRDHPDALIIRKDGTPDYEGPPGAPRRGEVGGAPSYLREFGGTGGAAATVSRIRDMVANLEYDYVYNDGSPTGISRLNWETKQVSQPYLMLEMFREIREAAGAANPNLAFLINGDYLPVADINYWEYYHWFRDNYDWRHVAVSLAVAKATAKPDAAILLHRWNNAWSKEVMEGTLRPADPTYANYLLAFGLVPMPENFPLDYLDRRLPIIGAAKELRGCRMVDAGLQPAWWHHPEPIGVEAYTLRKGAFGLVPVMSRQAASGTETVTFRSRALGLSDLYPVYAWVNRLALVDPEKDETGGRALRARALTCDSEGETGRVSVPLPGAGDALREKSAAGPLQLVVVSHVPIWVHSVDGIRFQNALPEQEGLTVRVYPSRTGQHQYRVDSRYQAARLFINHAFLDAGPDRVLLDYQPATDCEVGQWDEEHGLFVNIPEGSHILTISPSDP